jgi:hypothetical protein
MVVDYCLSSKELTLLPYNPLKEIIVSTKSLNTPDRLLVNFLWTPDGVHQDAWGSVPYRTG